MASLILQHSSRSLGNKLTPAASGNGTTFGTTSPLSATSHLCIPFQTECVRLQPKLLTGKRVYLGLPYSLKQDIGFGKSRLKLLLNNSCTIRREDQDTPVHKCRSEASAESFVPPSITNDWKSEGKSLSKSAEQLCRGVCLLLLIICFVSGKANAAEPRRRNKLKEERLAWERSQHKKPQGREDNLLGGLLNVSEQDGGPVKVDINIPRGARNARRNFYKAVYFTEDAIEDFRDKMRRSKLVVERRPNFFQRHQETTAVIQLCLCLALLVVAGKWVLRQVKNITWNWSGYWLKRKTKAGSRVRDRSLGGKEVVVGNQWDWLWGTRGREDKFRRQTLGGVRSKTEVVKHANPLDYEVDLRSEKDVLRARLKQEERKAALERRRQVEDLPDWWPRESLLPRPKVSDNRKEVGRLEAQQLLQKLVNMRVVGQDPTLEDIRELHETCQRYAVSVTFDASSTQESIYRVAVQHKLAQLMSAARYERIETSLRLSTARFVGLLAGDLGIQPRRAVDLVESIVAAKTKASFIQAYALLKQERTKEVQQELTGLALILSVFPLPLDSAKLELVGDGLSARFSATDRKELLDSICAVAGSKSLSEIAENNIPGVEDIAARALGLVTR